MLLFSTISNASQEETLHTPHVRSCLFPNEAGSKLCKVVPFLFQHWCRKPATNENRHHRLCFSPNTFPWVVPTATWVTVLALPTAGRASPTSKSSCDNSTQHSTTQISHSSNPFPSSPIISHSPQPFPTPKSLSPTPNTDVQPTSITNPCQLSALTLAWHCVRTSTDISH